MRSEALEEGPNVNIVLWSGIVIGDDKGKQLEESEWVRKVPEKEVGFDLERAKETFMEAKKSFPEASTLGRKDKPDKEMDPSMVTTFLETFMKFLRDYKATKDYRRL